MSGNVNKVYYQKGQEDQFIHRYAYDSDNRITHAETSKDDVYFERDAKYFYYDHGPLARTETGHRKLQSQDYAYTIQGWLKTVNGEQVDESTMMGGDGKTTGLNKYGGRDVSGYSLSYFDGDYSSSNTAMLNFSLSTVTAPNAGPGLYNGNIRAMYTGLSKTDELALKTHQTKYAYDQLNRIKSMDGQIISNGATPSYAPSGYSSRYAFDANGNLDTLKRYAMGTLMDKFKYHYLPGTNQLDYVYDNAGVSTLGDIGNTQTAGNYDYDAIGQLTADEDEGITGIAWTVTNKVKQVTKADGTVIRFDYDAMGHRIAKKVTTSTGVTTTYYVLDAQGNPMSIYEGITEADETYKLYLAERNIYGSSRIGTEKVNLEMNEASLQGYLPLNPIETIGVGELCTTTGEWYYEQTSTVGSLLDFNGDGNQDIKFSDATMASTGYSAQIGAHVVRGATYTLDFDLLNKTNIDLFSFEVRDCVSGTIYVNQVVASAGHASAVFTVPYDQSDRVRIKWLAQKHNSFTTARFTISQISLDGEGTEFDVMAAAQYGAVAHVIGDKYYEVANHLGNVLEVIRDIKLASNGGSGSVVAYSQPDVVSYSDYYPYGMQMPGRHDQNVYRYGFQGQEKDDEIKGGEGTSLNYEYRMHDPRVGRFFAVDPLSSRYPYYSPYAFSGNRVIDMVELEGLEPAAAADKNSSYTIAKKTGTSEYYGYKPEAHDDGTFSWTQGSKTTFSFGDLSKGSNGDDTKKYYRGQEVSDPVVIQGPADDEGTRLADFSAAFLAGAGLEGRAAENEAKRLLTNFVMGSWKSLSFVNGSQMSKLLRSDPAFQSYASAYELSALNYFKQNKTLEGFDGSAEMKRLGKPYIKDTWFMHTVLGGTQKWKTTITKITSNQIEVTYEVYDRFGAGTDDATSKLPGLPSLYWLQHNSYMHGAGYKKYAPFVWSITVNY